MTLNIRRIVTSHAPDGKAIVGVDKITNNVQQLRSGNFETLLWVTDKTPADTDDQDPIDNLETFTTSTTTDDQYLPSVTFAGDDDVVHYQIDSDAESGVNLETISFDANIKKNRYPQHYESNAKWNHRSSLHQSLSVQRRL